MTRARVRLALVMFVGCAACRRPAVPPSTQRVLPPSTWFVDRATETGLDFTHFNGMSGAQYYAEHMGPGVALFDYDNDGELDVFIPQGRMLGAGRKIEQALHPPKGPLKGRLF